MPVDAKEQRKLETRARIVALLKRNPDGVMVCEITTTLGISKETVRRHLAHLVETGCVAWERVKFGNVRLTP